MANKSYRHAKIPSRSTSYQKLLAVELDKLKPRLNFTFHEYWKQCPRELQKLYDMTSKHMLDMESIMLVIRNSSKKICAHLLIDREYYLTTYKASEREDLDSIMESIQRNFIIPMEKFLHGKEQ